LFDGCQSKNKAPEYGSKVCKYLMVPFLVSSEEADAQTVYCCPKFDSPPTLIVTGDSDLFAYGATRLIIVHSWADETFWSFNLNESAMNDSQNTLMKIYKIRGPLVFQIFAACCGCDFTATAS
jgi:5'-3' exonuclease